MNDSCLPEMALKPYLTQAHKLDQDRDDRMAEMEVQAGMEVRFKLE
jgi:hypothetical protein